MPVNRDAGTDHLYLSWQMDVSLEVAAPSVCTFSYPRASQLNGNQTGYLT